MGHMIGNVVDSISQKNTIYWFETESQAIDYLVNVEIEFRNHSCGGKVEYLTERWALSCDLI